MSKPSAAVAVPPPSRDRSIKGSAARRAAKPEQERGVVGPLFKIVRELDRYHGSP